MRQDFLNKRKGMGEEEAMKRLKLWLGVILLVCCLAGCGNQDATYDTTTLVVKDDGTFMEVVVEPFDKEYYDASELESFVKSEIQEYNLRKVSTQLSLEGVEVEDEIAKVTISYKTDEDYRNFNEGTVFVGTVREAIDEGYDFDQIFQEYGKTEEVSVAQVTENANYGVVITVEATNVVLPDKILYISENVTTKGKKTAQTDTGECYIIYKK